MSHYSNYEVLQTPIGESIDGEPIFYIDFFNIPLQRGTQPDSSPSVKDIINSYKEDSRSITIHT